MGATGKNPEQRAAWYAANRDRILAEKREQYKEKSDFKRAYQRKYRADNAEKVRKADRDRWIEYRKNDPEYRRNQNARAKEWYERNREYVIAKHRALRLLKEYGLTEEAYADMLRKQGGVCAICRKAQSGKKNFAVDHCHETGLVRGLLCDPCNQGIGFLGDNSVGVSRALQYLAAFEDSLESKSA